MSDPLLCRCGNFGRAFGADQLGPDEVPVIGPAHPARDMTICFLIKANAKMRRQRSITTNPRGDSALVVVSECLGQSRLRLEVPKRRLDVFGFGVLCHGRNSNTVR